MSWIFRERSRSAVVGVSAAIVVASLAVAQSSDARDAAPKGCAASNVEFYYDDASRQMDSSMEEVAWIPTWAADEGVIVGCVPNSLLLGGDALEEYGVNNPIPIFTPTGELYGYSVAGQGSVPLDKAVAAGDVPAWLIANPPVPSDFAEFTPTQP